MPFLALIWATTAVGAADADRFADGEETIGPDYADAPELTVKEGIPRGTLHEFTMDSKDSKIYPGIAKRQPGVVPYQRKVWVYVPKQYVPGTAAPFIVAQDGGGYLKSLVPALDTLTRQTLPAALEWLWHGYGR